MAIFELIGQLSAEFGIELFQRSLEGLFFQYLTNTAAAVRKMGVEKVGVLAERFGEEWIV